MAEAICWNPPGVRVVPYFKQHTDIAGYLNLRSTKHLQYLFFHESTRRALDLFMQAQKVVKSVAFC